MMDDAKKGLWRTFQTMIGVTIQHPFEVVAVDWLMGE